MLAKLDESDKGTFNWCLDEARRGERARLREVCQERSIPYPDETVPQPNANAHAHGYNDALKMLARSLAE